VASNHSILPGGHISYVPYYGSVLLSLPFGRYVASVVYVDIGLVHYSTHMSLTLARLCGESQLVSKNYEARGASGGKYEAQIVIFCILAAVNRFSQISWKAESR
jgi:hypothetical protein